LTGKIPAWPELQPEIAGAVAGPLHRPGGENDTLSSTYHVSGKAKLGRGVVLRDWVCVGDAVIGKNAQLQRSVVWDGTMVADGAKVVEQLVIA
jgi:NDP-sugar pyrophosphorylase family protein